MHQLTHQTFTKHTPGIPLRSTTVVTQGVHRSSLGEAGFRREVAGGGDEAASVAGGGGPCVASDGNRHGFAATYLRFLLQNPDLVRIW
jgi:hypothetical protein